MTNYFFIFNRRCNACLVAYVIGIFYHYAYSLMVPILTKNSISQPMILSNNEKQNFKFKVNYEGKENHSFITFKYVKENDEVRNKNINLKINDFISFINENSNSCLEGKRKTFLLFGMYQRKWKILNPEIFISDLEFLSHSERLLLSTDGTTKLDITSNCILDYNILDEAIKKKKEKSDRLKILFNELIFKQQNEVYTTGVARYLFGEKILKNVLENAENDMERLYLCSDLKNLAKKIQHTANADKCILHVAVNGLSRNTVNYDNSKREFMHDNYFSKWWESEKMANSFVITYSADFEWFSYLGIGYYAILLSNDLHKILNEYESNFNFCEKVDLIFFGNEVGGLVIRYLLTYEQNIINFHLKLKETKFELKSFHTLLTPHAGYGVYSALRVGNPRYFFNFSFDWFNKKKLSYFNNLIIGITVSGNNKISSMQTKNELMHKDRKHLLCYMSQEERHIFNYIKKRGSLIYKFKDIAYVGSWDRVRTETASAIFGIEDSSVNNYFLQNRDTFGKVSIIEPFFELTKDLNMSRYTAWGYIVKLINMAITPGLKFIVDNIDSCKSLGAKKPNEFFTITISNLEINSAQENYVLNKASNMEVGSVEISKGKLNHLHKFVFTFGDFIKENKEYTLFKSFSIKKFRSVVKKDEIYDYVTYWLKNPIEPITFHNDIYRAFQKVTNFFFFHASTDERFSTYYWYDGERIFINQGVLTTIHALIKLNYDSSYLWNDEIFLKYEKIYKTYVDPSSKSTWKMMAENPSSYYAIAEKKYVEIALKIRNGNNELNDIAKKILLVKDALENVKNQLDEKEKLTKYNFPLRTKLFYNI